jgi:hypothetical protein
MVYYMPLTVQGNAVARSQGGDDLMERHKQQTALISVLSLPISFKNYDFGIWQWLSDNFPYNVEIMNSKISFSA